MQNQSLPNSQPAPQATPAQTAPQPVAPAAPFPAVPQSAQPVQPTQPIPTPQPSVPPSIPRPGLPLGRRAPTGPSPRSLLVGCLSFFGCSLLLFVIFAIAFVASTSATGDNGLARALGVNAAQFTNSLITITNLVFGLVVMVTFFVMIIGFARNLSTPKADLSTKSKTLKQGLVALLIFLLLIAIWVFVYLFLIGKRVNIPQTNVSTFITVPEDTLRQIAPFEVSFDATKLPYNPAQVDITFYQWDFGDGGEATAPLVTHTYTSVGQFTAKLEVTARDKRTNQDLTQEFSKLVTIIGSKLVADFTASPSSGPAPLTVSFDASLSKSPSGQITSYSWDFTGQSNFRDAEGQKAEYTFSKEGDYKVSLRVTDNTGQEPTTISKTITVTGPNVPTPVLDIPTSDGKYYAGTLYTFYGEKTTSPNGQINKYEWDFGDGSPKANTRTATHTYSSVGTYEVILKATDEQNKVGTNAKKIEIVTKESAPVAVISSVPLPDSKTKAIMGKVPLEIAFSASGSNDPDKNIVEYQWDFDGDGTTDTSGENVTYVYKEVGVYNAKLTVIDAAKNQSSVVQVVKTEAQGITAKLVSDLVDGTAPLTVSFDATGSTYPSGQISSYEWDFGDGSPKRIDVATVSHKYTSIGTFTATVKAKASDGTTSTAQLIINVRPVALTACFVPSVESGPAPLTVELDPRCSQGAAVNYTWDFGDGETSRLRKPIHVFNTPGTYQVTLEVSDNENTIDTYSKDLLVTGNL